MVNSGLRRGPVSSPLRNALRSGRCAAAPPPAAASSRIRANWSGTPGGPAPRRPRTRSRTPPGTAPCSAPAPAAASRPHGSPARQERADGLDDPLAHQVARQQRGLFFSSLPGWFHQTVNVKRETLRCVNSLAYCVLRIAYCLLRFLIPLRLRIPHHVSRFTFHVSRPISRYVCTSPV